MVNFEAIGPDRTRVALHLAYEPEGVTEHIGDALGVVGARVSEDLKRFKKFIETRGEPTGAWRGRIRGREVQPLKVDLSVED